MQIELSGNVEKIVNQMVSSGKYETAEEAINAIVLQASQTLNGAERRNPPAETPLAKAERLGLIGAAQGLPADLSCHERHMEGFGRS